MTVLIHFQLVRSRYQSVAPCGPRRSLSSMYTGMRRTLNALCENTGPRRYSSQSTANLMPWRTHHPSER